MEDKNYALLECDNCSKAKASPSRGKFYVQLMRIENILNIICSCNTCKQAQIFRIIDDIPKDKLGTGMIYHCFGLVHKVYLTKDTVIVACTKCNERLRYPRKKNE